MPLPTIADCYRLAIDWTNVDGRSAVNVLHILAPSSTEAAVAQQVAESMLPDMWRCVGGDAEIQSLTITKLDGTPDGRVYGQAQLVTWNSTPDTFNGGGGTSYIPQASALVKELTTSSGRSGRGRVFLPWLGETVNDNGAIHPADRDDTTTAWIAFANDLVANSMALAIASYTHSYANQVEALFCESYSATQRRRNSTFR